MISFDKIMELLSKDKLTDEEKKLLNDTVEKDPEARKASQVYLQLKASLKRDGHIDEELMGEYVLFKNNIPGDRTMMFLSGMVEDHIRKCGQCEALFREFNAEYSEVDNLVSRTVSATEADRGSSFLVKNFNGVKYAFVSFAAVVVLYLMLFAVSSLTTPGYKESFTEREDFYTTRGRTSELFQRGLDAIDREDYDSAIKYLNEDAQNNREDGSIFYTHFILGITYLNKAENDYLGLFRSYNRDEVEKAIASFEKSIALNNSGRFNNLKLDAQYFIGRSFLLIDETESAKEHLQSVVDGKGSYYKKAEELLKEL